MSKEYIAAEMALFEEQCREVDIVITTVRLITSVTTFCSYFITGSHSWKASSEVNYYRDACRNETRICCCGLGS